MVSNRMTSFKTVRYIILWRFVLAVAVSGIAPSMALTADQINDKPQREFVVVNNAPVRADASDRNDPATLLPRGTAVSIFIRKSNGWCAIRPPVGSFSWVAARYVSMDPKTGATFINHDDPASWIGSDQTDRRLAWQIRLKKGESVRVLDTKSVVTDSSGVVQPWCKILPPNGEFRWIHASQLSSTEPAQIDTTAVAATATPPSIEPAQLPADPTVRHLSAVGTGVKPQMKLQPVPPVIETASHTTPKAAEPQNVKPALHIEQPKGDTSPEAEPGFNVKQTAWRARTPGNSRITEPGVTRPREMTFTPKEKGDATPATPSPTFQSRSIGTSYTTSTAATMTDPSADRRVVEMELSRIAALTPDLWHFDNVRARAENLVRRGKTFQDRERGKKILGEIKQFEQLRQRRDQLAAARLKGTASTVASQPAVTPLVPTPPPLTTPHVVSPPRVALVPATPRAQHDSLFSWVPRGLIGTRNQTADASTNDPALQIELGSEVPAPGATATAPTPDLSPPATAAPAPVTPPANTDAVADSPYNGVGRLMPVVFSPTDPQANSRQRGPLYALMSPNGKILQLISPSPGMNLSSYKGRHVGIVGRNGPPTPWQTPHLVAERIITLKDQRR